VKNQTIQGARLVVPRPQTPAARALPALLALYCAASFAHFWHNAEFLMQYPNLPACLTRMQVYAVWLGMTAVGVVGYLLLRARWRRPGLAVLAVYAAMGFDGPALHMGSLMAHSGTMNGTIWSEVVAAALVLVPSWGCP
jgi:hypothetical protein